MGFGIESLPICLQCLNCAERDEGWYHGRMMDHTSCMDGLLVLGLGREQMVLFWKGDMGMRYRSHGMVRKRVFVYMFVGNG